MVFNFVMFLVLGLIVGIFARWRLPRGDASGWFGPVGLAVVGSMVGGSIAAALYPAGGAIVFLMAVLAAVTVIVVHQAIVRRHLHA